MQNLGRIFWPTKESLELMKLSTWQKNATLMMKRTLPLKLKDQGSVTISCTIDIVPISISHIDPYCVVYELLLIYLMLIQSMKS